MQIDSIKLEKFITHLKKWNKTHKLTNYNRDSEIKKNIEDSIAPVEFFDFTKVKTILDIGSGAGFPALFLALVLPNIKFTLVEPLGKKYSFLNFIKCELELNNVEVKKVRVEDLDNQNFDLIVSRAVTDTESLIKLSKKFITENNQLLLYKGSSVDKEIENIRAKKFEFGNRVYLTIRGSECL